ncbi:MULTISPECIES: acetoacetate--CoA ligase [unclassified Virgibacillus]|uniref:acetoacetate--CoA ligase n=1 Tax=unclassified Virgibacillus TaxID=2620237 RepID=UPI000909A852|nr:MULTISPECIES: acetoacetate--CoA ligase [unclassified Virgibacillus]API92829.1 acetoacetate--CoA ligase [Virgibacillus sp. 6R]MBS7428338.1 acetoacetate--CoA ligase [Virgibacillus sp. 19R1-5]
MKQVEEGILLWEPSEERKTTAKINSYIKWLGEHKNMHFQDYHALWDWSVHEIEAFWASIWDYFDLQAEEGYQTILSSHHMPGAKWFPEATVNYTEHIFRNRATSNQPAIIHTSESRKIKTVSWRQLYQDTAAMQQVLKRLGIQKGDRVVAYLPNIYEAVVAFLATASVGAIWSSASPDFGTQSVIDRFQQIEPKLFFTIDGYVYGGKAFDRTDVAAEIQSSLPTLEATIAISYLEEQATFASLQHVIHWEQTIKEAPVRPLSFTYVAFNDPLWVLFSSGTTGKPKPIVQSQGGILLEHLKALTFHVDLGEGDRFFWFTTTGWMMWNFLIGGLLTGSTIILYDGNPAYPSKGRLWQLAEETKMTVFGTSASYITSCMKDNIKPYENYDLSQLKNISSTGSPLPPEGFLWCYENVKKDLWIASASGGTDVCTAFILGVPTLPVYAGELQCRGLGAKIESFNDNGKPVIEEVGELVLTEPFPSMPIYFWNDPDGSRLKESYFNVFPGIWRHGDYLKITKRKTCVIYGRSDATINRGGVRIGTSEIYRAVDHIPEIADSLIVDIPQPNSDSFVPLFVVMKDGCQLTDDLKQQINQHIRAHCSPRHVPTGIYEVPDLPRTLNGKKLEIPVKKILQGKQMEQIVNKGSLHNAAALDAFYQFAEKIKT